APRGRRRLDRAGHDDAPDRPDAPGGGGGRSAPPGVVAPLPVAVLLRDGHRAALGAAGRRPLRRRDPQLSRGRLACLPGAAPARPEVVGGIGGFGGFFAFDPGRWSQPLLVSTTDGVGTKSEVARLLGRYDTIGLDCVAMSVDDLAVCGAEPLFFLDYVSVGRNDPAMVEALVAGVAEGCAQAGCALVGGEISEHAGVMEPGQFDLVGFAVGVVEADGRLPAGVRAGDRVVGVASPGMRSNGYTLARKVLLEPGAGNRGQVQGNRGQVKP